MAVASMHSVVRASAPAAVLAAGNASSATVGGVHLTQARSAHVATAERLVAERSEAQEVHSERIDRRVLGVIVQELEVAMALVPPPLPTKMTVDGGGPSLSLVPPPVEPPAVRAQQAVALIEKIELFVKSQRPALSLTLNNSLGARVEIERLGPKEVALKLYGHGGPPSVQTLTRLREALEARGLTLRALSIA